MTSNDENLIAPLQIRLAKAALGMSNPELAKATGLHKNTLNAAEKPGANPSRSTLMQLRQYFESRGVVFVAQNGGPAGVRFNELGEAPSVVIDE